MTTTANFLGIPIDGDITKPDRRVPQKPLSDLEPLFRAVLDDPYIAKLGWTQYTPYFNDGDPCTFRVGEPWFRTVDDVKESAPSDSAEVDEDDDEDEEDGSFTIGYSGHPTLGKRDYEWDHTRGFAERRKVYKPYVGAHETTYDACLALAEAIDSGAFEDVLLETFGDHCRVTVAATGITVDEYSHD